jgi:hypothetical protein
MDTYDMIKKLSNHALDKGSKYNGDGSNNYAYSFGCFVGEIEYILEDLELTPKQLELLRKSIEKRVGV